MAESKQDDSNWGFVLDRRLHPLGVLGFQSHTLTLPDGANSADEVADIYLRANEDLAA